MTESQQAYPSDHSGLPGKTRTWWHPLLARLLDFSLKSAYTVQEEVLVGRMPLQVDILLIRRESGQLPQSAYSELSALLQLLNRFTLIEFKGPTDVLERGDFAQLVGCAYLWHGQQNEPIPREDITLVVIAPALSIPLEKELGLLGFEADRRKPGMIWITGLPFSAWLLETDILAERDQPILATVSRLFLSDRQRIMDELKDHPALLRYMLQQVKQFRSRGEDFIMQHTHSEDLAVIEEELLSKVLETVPPQRRMKGLPAEERLRGLPAEERVRGLSPEELLAAMDKEQAARLRELMERKQDH